MSLATHTVIGALSSPMVRPSLNPARSLSARIPLLVGIGQWSVAQGELRRFIELISWAVYFTDHPVEWEEFKMATSTRFAQDTTKPISFAAHRELGFYLQYALELMDREPSGLGERAVEDIKNVVKALNSSVHAAHLAKAGSKIPPHDDLSEPVLRTFADIERQTFSSCTLLIAAYRRTKFNQLDATARAHFDWLIGPKLRREVRKGPFGIA